MWEDKMFRIKVIFRLLHFGFKSDMNFHFDFFCGLFSSILWIGLPIVFFRLIFLNIDSFNGWDYYQILFLVGSYTIVDGVMMGLLIRSMGILESDILSGNLDQILLRPFDTQLFYIFRSFNLVQFVNTFFGLAIIFISYGNLKVHLNSLKILYKTRISDANGAISFIYSSDILYSALFSNSFKKTSSELLSLIIGTIGII